MARKLRPECPGAIYHVMNRGDRRKPIFKDDFDRQRFLQTLGEACAKTGWQIHAYCLMGNHFHLALETPQPNLRSVPRAARPVVFQLANSRLPQKTKNKHNKKYLPVYSQYGKPALA